MEFKDKTLVTSFLESKEEVKIGERVLIVDSAGRSKINNTAAAATTTTKVKQEKKKAKVKPAGT